MNTININPILILDFGSQYTQLIARRLREFGVYCEIKPYNLDISYLNDSHPIGIIISGGPATVTLEYNPRAPEWIFNSGLPILGICYGMQTMAVQLGGFVSSSDLCEFGYAKASIKSNSQLLGSIITDEFLDVWMSHGDKVTILPPGFEVTASTDNTSIAGMENHIKQWYGVQFHPEVTHTKSGDKILDNFVFNICHAEKSWTTKSIIVNQIEEIKDKVKNDKVLLGLSGGVDSSVVAALLHKAIGDNLICVFVDTGLLRLNEAEKVKEMFEAHLGVNIIWVDARERFLNSLKGITCPEKKRKTIGKTFIEVFDNEASKLNNITWLAQGTIYSDVIESAAASANGVSEVIKSHHNVGGLPKNMQLKLLEPLSNLFKDEVRKVGIDLGLPHSLVFRHPFPGPGLGVRVLGEVKREFVEILQKADDIYLDELVKANLYDKVSQAFSVFLPVKSVGVMGDDRKYAYVIALRAVETTDFMTANWSHLPWGFLATVSNRIINEVKGVSRVTYDISGKPPATIEWE
ncbi:MAG: glutamine-hydrolyzing GMP synthase [Legionellales bacterium RIFCSPHIGHO2_12_FULL_35_11]|nr:MAG: glutamine-hydrolyzing GMP synthase [Legionellales bacterium RIFCSPHIGHO2_12_FULL_35_11]